MSPKSAGRGGYLGLARSYNLKGMVLNANFFNLVFNSPFMSPLLKFPGSQVEGSGKQVLRQFYAPRLY